MRIRGSLTYAVTICDRARLTHATLCSALQLASSKLLVETTRRIPTGRNLTCAVALEALASALAKGQPDLVVADSLGQYRTWQGPS
eukprot:615908-Rhodomonas_salina.4